MFSSSRLAFLHKRSVQGLLVIALLLLIVGMGIIHLTPAHAASACSGHPDYLDIYSPVQGDSCFAGDGYRGFRIDDAVSIHAGNNDGWVLCYGGGNCDPAGTQYPFHAYDVIYLDTNYNGTGTGALITQVDITGQG